MGWQKFLVFFAVLWLNGWALAAEPRPSWRTEWDKIVAAAEKEGGVSAYIFEAGPLTDYFDADDDRNSDRRPADKLFSEILGKAAK